MAFLPIALGALLGSVAGWLVWLAAGRLVMRYQALSRIGIGGGDPSVNPADTSAALGAWPTVWAMTLWGAYSVWQASNWIVVGMALAATGILLCIAIVDFRVGRIPDVLVLALLVLAVAQIAVLARPTWQAALLGAAFAGGLFFLLRVISRGAMGLGDVKLETTVGALVGYPAVVGAMFTGVVIGGLVALMLLLTRRVNRKTPIAYGPYLALGAWLVWVRILGLWP